MHIKKNDIVKILSGKDKGKTGKVLEAYPREGKVLVEGVNLFKKHERARKQGQKGQTVDRAVPIHASKVAAVEALKAKKATKK